MQRGCSLTEQPPFCQCQAHCAASAGIALRRIWEADHRLAVNIAMAGLLALCAVGLAL